MSSTSEHLTDRLTVTSYRHLLEVAYIRCALVRVLNNSARSNNYDSQIPTVQRSMARSSRQLSMASVVCLNIQRCSQRMGHNSQLE
eukprot:scaffold261_cov28-Prasinocladus_malaysianus.AAC.1